MGKYISMGIIFSSLVDSGGGGSGIDVNGIIYYTSWQLLHCPENADLRYERY